MVYHGATLLLLERIVHQARADTSAAVGYTPDVDTEAQAQRIRDDAADFLASVRAAYLDMAGEPAGAVLEVIARRRLADPAACMEPEEAARMSRCSRCGELKDAIQFYTINSHGKTRLDYWCSRCRQLYKRKSHGRRTS